MTDSQVEQLAMCCLAVAVVVGIAAVICWCRLCDYWSEKHRRETDMKRRRMELDAREAERMDARNAVDVSTAPGFRTSINLKEARPDGPK